jgi:large subunit ribosomal protein L24
MSFKMKKGDKVRIVAGKERGKEAQILHLLPKKKRAIVQGLNFVKKHTRPRGQGQPAGIIEREAPLPISNCMLVCPGCNKPTRIGYKVVEKGKKLRVCKKCGETIDKE